MTFRRCYRITFHSITSTMPSVASDLKSRTWKRDGFSISTDHKIIPLDRLTEIMDSPSFYWANAIPLTALEEMLEQSLCFGLFRTQTAETEPDNTLVTNEQRQHNNLSGEKDPGSTTHQQSAEPEEAFIGFARCVTDFSTFVYLTDVWVDPTCQGQGLGKWLLTCMRTCELLEGERHTWCLSDDIWPCSTPSFLRHN